MMSEQNNQPDGFYTEHELLPPDEDPLQQALVLEHARRTRASFELMAAAMDLTVGLCGDE
jgi:hypothetical protein